jgi:hypothetical protein
METLSSLIHTIWDDINQDMEAIPISNIEYEVCALVNKLYDPNYFNNQKKNKIGNYDSNKPLIQKHKNTVSCDAKIIKICKLLLIDNIDPLDMIFVNAYYRRILRAKLEMDFMNGLVSPGLVITYYSNYMIDEYICDTLRYLKVICNFLGIKSTIHENQSFKIDKLLPSLFWNNISEKFINLFGENKINYIEKDDDIEINSVDKAIFIENRIEIRRIQILKMLNNIFHTWSGSLLIYENDLVRVIPAIYIQRMTPKVCFNFKKGQ